MTYLHEGETLRSRLDDLLGTARSVNNNPALKREFLDEAAVVASLLRADEDAAYHAAYLGDELKAPLPHWLGEVGVEGTVELYDPKPFRPDWLYTEEMIREAHEILLVDHGQAYLESTHSMLMATLKEIAERDTLGREVNEQGESDPVKVYPFADDPRVDDSIVYGATGAEPTPHLPTEQLPATDPNPATEFDFDTSAAEAKEAGVDIEDVVGSRYEEEPDLDDFFSPEEIETAQEFASKIETEADVRAEEYIAERGVEPKKPRQAPKSSTDGFKKLQEKKKGKATK